MAKDNTVTLKAGDKTTVAFDIAGSGIIRVPAIYTGEYGTLGDTNFYYFEHADKGTEYSFTLEQLTKFKEMAARHTQETITY